MLDSGTVELKFKKESVNKIIDECISRTEVLADIRDVRIEKPSKMISALTAIFAGFARQFQISLRTALSIPTAAVMSEFQPKGTACIRKSS